MARKWITVEEFNKRLKRVGDCLEWTMSCHPTGYGAINTGGRVRCAHRVSWIIRFGDPGDLDVCHRCDNPPCCNPEHLFLGTANDNARDMLKKGRCTQQRITEKQAREVIRALSFTQEDQSSIARRLGIGRHAVVDILRGKTWGCVLDEFPPIPERNRSAKKLTADDAREIRRLRASGWTYPALAEKFGVHHSMAMNIVKGKQWKDA